MGKGGGEGGFVIRKPKGRAKTRGGNQQGREKNLRDGKGGFQVGEENGILRMQGGGWDIEREWRVTC